GSVVEVVEFDSQIVDRTAGEQGTEAGAVRMIRGRRSSRLACRLAPGGQRLDEGLGPGRRQRWRIEDLVCESTESAEPLLHGIEVVAVTTVCSVTLREAAFQLGSLSCRVLLSASPRTRLDVVLE